MLHCTYKCLSVHKHAALYLQVPEYAARVPAVILYLADVVVRQQSEIMHDFMSTVSVAAHKLHRQQLHLPQKHLQKYLSLTITPVGTKIKSMYHYHI